MKRSKQILSHTKLLSCDMGQLVPIGLTEILPGDTVQHATSALVRTQPLFAPVMHPVDVRIHHWYVPTRLLWDEFEDFITGGPQGTSTPDLPHLVMPLDGAAIGSLADYLGIPTGVGGLEVSALPFRAYQKIWNEYYRDQDLMNEAAVGENSGWDTTTSEQLQNICWEKDNFTSARPWEQKGTAVSIPLAGGEIAVRGMGKIGNNMGSGPQNNVMESDGTRRNYAGAAHMYDPSGVQQVFLERKGNDGAGDIPNLRVDLSGVSAVTITNLREAMAIQRYEEARARFGSRYTEYLRYLGVRSSDARLDRPEYLGGGSQKISFSEVLQTAQDADTPVGTMRGHGIGSMRSNRYRRFFEEHGYVISLLSVRPKSMYVQGLHKLWSKKTKEDFWQMELQHIGQQEILNREIYAGHTKPDDVFGYEDRYAEYRSQPSTIAGEFRSTVLDHWHLARTFSGDPALNESFVKCVPSDRIFPVQTHNKLYIMAKHNMVARRLVAASSASYIY